jgi:hypothetical protein
LTGAREVGAAAGLAVEAFNFDGAEDSFAINFFSYAGLG